MKSIGRSCCDNVLRPLDGAVKTISFKLELKKKKKVIQGLFLCCCCSRMISSVREGTIEAKEMSSSAHWQVVSHIWMKGTP